MGGDDKVKNTGAKIVGETKETAGAAVGNESLEAEGKKERKKSDLKQAGEKVKDAFRK